MAYRKTVSDIAVEMPHREAIRECLYRYCRGVDRLDAELVLSAFWPECTDDHCNFFFESPVDFIEKTFPMMQEMDQTQHMLGNILIDIDGDVAYVESYGRAFHRVHKPNEKPYDFVTGHRYVDRFERRQDEWRVLKRVVIRDWFRIYPDSADWDQGIFGHVFESAKRKPADRSYALLRDLQEK